MSMRRGTARKAAFIGAYVWLAVRLSTPLVRLLIRTGSSSFAPTDLLKIVVTCRKDKHCNMHLSNLILTLMKKYNSLYPK